MADDDDRDKRTYTSPLREAQARQTRDHILGAFAEVVVRENPIEFSIQRLAEVAAVSVRTIYRHFPTRQDLIDGLARMWDEADHPDPPMDLDAMPAQVHELYAHFDANREIVEALHLTHLGQQINVRSRALRNARFADKYAELLERLPRGLRERVMPVCRTMFGSRTWVAMRHEFGLSSEQAAECVEWVLGLVIDDLKRQADAWTSEPSDDDDAGAPSDPSEPEAHDP